jgi:alkylhydroperoxidase family enzyme
MLNTKSSGQMFEVWDLVSRNIVGEFDEEREALALVSMLTTEGGQGATGAFALVREDAQGDSVTIATGTDLIVLAHRSRQESAAS